MGKIGSGKVSFEDIWLAVDRRCLEKTGSIEKTGHEAVAGAVQHDGDTGEEPYDEYEPPVILLCYLLHAEEPAYIMGEADCHGEEDDRCGEDTDPARHELRKPELRELGVNELHQGGVLCREAFRDIPETTNMNDGPEAEEGADDAEDKTLQGHGILVSDVARRGPYRARR